MIFVQEISISISLYLQIVDLVRKNKIVVELRHGRCEDVAVLAITNCLPLNRIAGCCQSLESVRKRKYPSSEDGTL